jgi:hypothetical protein
LWQLSANGAGTNVEPTTPAGWTVWRNIYSDGTTNGQTIFYRFASSEPASYSATTVAGKWVGVMGAYRGVDPTTPSDATPTTASSDVAASITTVTDGAWVLVHARDLVASGFAGVTYTVSSGTIRAQAVQTSGVSNAIAGYSDQIQATAGSVTPVLDDPANTSAPTRVTSALRPAT